MRWEVFHLFTRQEFVRPAADVADGCSSAAHYESSVGSPPVLRKQFAEDAFVRSRYSLR